MSFFKFEGVGYQEESADRENLPVINLQPNSLFFGLVVDCTAHYGTMRILTSTQGIILGIPIYPGSTGVFGPRRIGACYPPHSKVICYQPPGKFYCYVLGAIPDWIVHGELNKIPDWIVPGCFSGLGFDGAHYLGLERENGKVGDINFAAGRPCDELPGDFGYINELGVGLGLGKLMAWLRASHFCGIEAFWIDNLLRLTSQNLEIFTEGSEFKVVSDESEWSEIFRWGHLPWEALGLFENEQDFTKHGGDSWRSGKPGRIPKIDGQTGLWRVKRFRGYLGDLERTFVSLVNKDLAKDFNSEAKSYEAITNLPGVLDVGYSPNGSFHVRSAKSILLEKTVTIPIPEEVHLPDDPEGDTSENYAFSGIYGKNPERHIKKDLDFSDEQAGLRSFVLLERHAVLYGLAQNLAFLNHEKDWNLPRESTILENLSLDKGLYVPSNEINEKDFWMPIPKSSEIDIDHREKTKYYTGKACIKIEDDGSILLEDAYGSQIRMEGGNIFLAARNDVILQPGRNVQLWAPHDAIIKSGNSTDISASLGDVRVKAQGNLMLYSDEKGVLIESGYSPEKGDENQNWSSDGEDVESRGIILKASNSKILSLSKDAYFRTGVEEGTEGDSSFILDAGAGKGKLVVHSGEESHNVENRYQVILGSETTQESLISLDLTREKFIIGGNTLQEIIFGTAKASFGHERFDRIQFFVHGDIFNRGRLFVTSDSIIDGSLLLNGSFVGQKNIHIGGSALFTGSILAAGIAVDNGGGLLPSTGDDFNASEQTPPEHPRIGKELSDSDQIVTQNKITQENLEDFEYIKELNVLLYNDENSFANPVLLSQIGFTFRTTEQYGINDPKNFVWYEARWQQFNRLLFSTLTPKLWKEPSIRSRATHEETMPYPGKEVWENTGSFLQLNPKYFDYNRGISSDAVLDELESSNRELSIQKASKSFKDGYVITLQKPEE